MTLKSGNWILTRPSVQGHKKSWIQFHLGTLFCKNTPDSKQQKNVEIIHWNISRSNQGHSFDSFGKHRNPFLETEISTFQLCENRNSRMWFFWLKIPSYPFLSRPYPSKHVTNLSDNFRIFLFDLLSDLFTRIIQKDIQYASKFDHFS